MGSASHAHTCGASLSEAILHIPVGWKKQLAWNIVIHMNRTHQVRALDSPSAPWPEPQNSPAPRPPCCRASLSATDRDNPKSETRTRFDADRRKLRAAMSRWITYSISKDKSDPYRWRHEVSKRTSFFLRSAERLENTTFRPARHLYDQVRCCLIYT